VRTLILATKACRALDLPAEAIDWQKLFATVAAEYAQGRTERDIDWEKVAAGCAVGEQRVVAGEYV
jgi:hypothetical protein